MINKQLKKKKRHVAKRAGCPELQRVGEAHSHMLTVNKQAGWRRQEWHPCPATLQQGKLVTVAVMWKAPPDGEEGHPPT
jgi:hypothetical protein